MKLGLLFRVLGSNLAQIGRILFGVKITYRMKRLISPYASLRTFGTGRICYGNKVEIRPNTEITARDAKIKIGNNCFINRNCMIVSHEYIEIGDKVTIGPGTVIYDHDHNGTGGYVTAPVLVGDGAWLGAGVIILKGVKIGKNAVVAAGTVVTGDVPEGVTVYQKRETSIKQ